MEKDVTEGSYKNGNRSLTESRGIGSIDIYFEKAKKKLDKGTKEDKASHPSNVAGEIGGINESMIYEGVNDNPVYRVHVYGHRSELDVVPAKPGHNRQHGILKVNYGCGLL